MPSLQSFCLYCAVGIFAVYVFQATLFVACVALDMRRLKQNRNGFLVCYKHTNYVPPKVTGILNMRRKIFRQMGVWINHIIGTVRYLTPFFTSIWDFIKTNFGICFDILGSKTAISTGGKNPNLYIDEKRFHLCFLSRLLSLLSPLP